METQSVCTGKVECHQISFTLNIKNTVEPEPVQPFPVRTTSGQTLLQAMEAYQLVNTDFSFRTKDLPTSGPYVVEVMRVKNGPDKFWETLLYNQSQEVIPLNLCYKVCDGDNVYLRFSNF